MNTCTCYTLRKLSRTVTRIYDVHLAQAGLRTTQYSLLRTIAHQPMPMADLAQKLATERTTLTRNLKPLIDAGWVRLDAGDDARQRIASITHAGRGAIAAAKAAWRRAQNAVEQTIGLRDLEALHRHADSALQKLTPLVERIPDAYAA